MRGWPLDYHSMLYSAESTRASTVIDLKVFEDALEAMWNPEYNKTTRGPPYNKEREATEID